MDNLLTQDAEPDSIGLAAVRRLKQDERPFYHVHVDGKTFISGARDACVMILICN